MLNLNIFSKKRFRVNLFIIGEQKCGTTSMHELLKLNAAVLSPTLKECQYFNTERYNENSGFSDYHSLFDTKKSSRPTYFIDSTPDYLSQADVINKIYKYNPEAKFIVMLRDPVSRFISAYNFYFSNILGSIEEINNQYFKYSEKGRSIYNYLKLRGDISIEDFLDDELSGKSPIRSFERGLYFRSISRWLQVFPENSFCFLFFENLKTSDLYKQEIEILESFLSLTCNGHFPQENISKKKLTLDDQLKAKLTDRYKQDNEQLKTIVKRPIPWLVV